MKLSREELNKIKPISNYCLIKPDKIINDVINLKGGIKLFAVGNFEPLFNVGVIGEVIRNPLGLYFDKDYYDSSMPWDTEIEIYEGCTVMYNYYAAVQALGHLADPLNPEKNPRYIICEDEVYMFLKYSDLILKKEGDDITPLNGYVLCEPMYDTEKTKILLPEHLRKKVSLQYAKVYKTGSRIKEYIEDAYCRDGNEVREGDTIVFKKFNNISIEWDTHRVLDKELYRIQRRFIEAIIKGNTGDIQKDIQPL